MTRLTRRDVSLGLLGVGMTGISGCAPQPKLLGAPFVGQPNTRSVLVATNRTMTPDPQVQFVEGRTDTLQFLNYDISIPSKRAPGSFSFPKQSLDPEREFYVARTERYANSNAFVSGINEHISTANDASGNLLVFVHGYNASYAATVFRAAQIATDFGLDMPVVLFSWPSAGRITSYVYDRDSALFARSALAETLATLARTQARKITILAHSMGGMLAMEAIKRLTLEGDTHTLSRVDGLVLAQPDIDVDVFRSQISDFDLQKTFVSVLTSDRDRALKLSSILTGGHPRVGNAQNIEELRKLGVLVIDVTNIGSPDFLNHDTYASSPALLQMIRTGKLSQRIIAGLPGQDLLIQGANLTGKAALAIAYLPYTIAGL